MKKLILGLGLFILALGSSAQYPVGITQHLSSQSLPNQTVSPLDLNQLASEDAQREKNGEFERMGIAENVSASPSLTNSGSWLTLPNGNELWRTTITAPSAVGTILSLRNVNIPAGGEIYAYRPDGSVYLGPYTQKDASNGYLTIATIYGGDVILEYSQPAGSNGNFELFSVGQVYRLIGPHADISRDFGDSDPCQVNVECFGTTIATNPYLEQARGVARILLKDGANWGWCSGSLVNNTNNDCAPLFLTAHHCGETSSAADRNQWLFYFNYRSSGCSNPATDPIGGNPFNPTAGSQYTQGCTQLSHSNDGGGASGSDYKLVNLGNLSQTNIQNWNLYFNGWDATNVSSGTWSNGYGIHHPSGDIAKISTYSGSLTTTQWNGNGLPSHWLVTWTSNAQGHGVTEGGSSGSPIFNSNDLIVGTLTGGSSYCTAQSSPDMYGKMSYHWDQNANPLGGHLEDFLDPGNTGTLVLSGTYSPCAPSAPNCAASASATNVLVGQQVDFTDNSSNLPTSWNWTFGDGNSSTLQNPSHTYTAPGTYTVTLTATNAQGSCSTTLTIVVSNPSPCDTLNWTPPGTLTVYSSTEGYVAGWNDYFDISKAQKFTATGYDYVTGGIYYFFDVQDGGNNATVDFNIWSDNAGTPNTIIGTTTIDLSVLATAVGAGNAVPIQVFFPTPVNVGAANTWHMGFTMNGFGTGDSLGLVSNTDGDGTTDVCWEQWSDNSWNSISGAWNLTIDLSISPYVTNSLTTINMAATTPTTICEGDDISYDATGTANQDSVLWYFVGGTPFNSSNMTETVNYGTAGSYTTYMEAYGSCGQVALDSIENIVVNAAPTVTATATDASCGVNDGTITIGATGGTGSYQYSIDNGVTYQASNSFTGLAPGTYAISVDDGNCIGTTTVTVNQGASTLTVNATATDENCGNSDGTITATATGATQYSLDGVTWQASGTFSGLTAGSYTVYAEDAGGCQGSTTVTVGANNNAPTASATGTDENCSSSDGTITVSATGGAGSYQYSIDGGTTFQGSGNFTGLSSGTYNVVVEDAVGCQGTTTVTIGNAGGPVINSVSGTDVTCNGAGDGTITINATGATQYSIDGVTFQASNVFTGLAPGSYTVYADNGACVTTDFITINEPTAVSHTVTINNASCTNDGSIVVTAAGGSGSYQYSIDNGTTFQTGNTFASLAGGTYQVIVIDSDGCTSAMTNETVGSNPAVTVAGSGADETCNAANGSISAAATGGNGSFTYSIDGTNFQGNGTFTGLSAGTYTVTAMDGNGCTGTTIITITNTGSVTASASPDQTICAGQSVTLTASGGTGYSWSDGATVVGTTASITVSPTSTTTYTVTVDDGTCTDQATTIVTVNQVPTTTVTGDTDICAGETATLTASGGSSYFWAHSGETTASVNVSPTSGTVQYSVVASNGNCQGNVATISVTVSPAAVASAGSDVTTTYLGQGGNVNFNNSGSLGTSYNWDFGDGNSSTSANPSHSYTAAGTYTVILTATLGNCTATDTIIIEVLNGVGLGDEELLNAVDVYPNPSNGEFNVNFKLSESKDVEIRVYNAIGSLIEVISLNNVSNYNQVLNLGGQAEGFYFINIQTKDGVITKRVSLRR